MTHCFTFCVTGKGSPRKNLCRSFVSNEIRNRPFLLNRATTSSKKRKRKKSETCTPSRVQVPALRLFYELLSVCSKNINLLFKVH